MSEERKLSPWDYAELINSQLKGYLTVQPSGSPMEATFWIAEVTPSKGEKLYIYVDIPLYGDRGKAVEYASQELKRAYQNYLDKKAGRP